MTIYTRIFMVIVWVYIFLEYVNSLVTSFILRIVNFISNFNKARERIGMVGIMKMQASKLSRISWRAPQVNVDKKTISIKYYYNGKHYVCRYPKKRLPPYVMAIRTLSGSDVTEDVSRYMGIDGNFHSIKTTPGLLGYNTLIFVMTDDKVYEFSRDETISI